MPGEHHRDEHAGDLIGAEPQVAVFVGDGDENVEHVTVTLVGRRMLPAPRHDVLHQRDELLTRLVAQPKALDRQIGIDIAQRVGATLELVIQACESRVQLRTEFLADQACRRGVDGEFGEELEQIDLTGIAPTGDHPTHLVLDRRSVALHLLAAKGRVVQHLLAPLRTGIEVHPLAEDRRHKRVRRGAAPHQVGKTLLF
jgi:hypothetical protein